MLTLSAPAHVYITQGFNLTGSLKTKDGSLLGNRSIDVYWNATGSPGWNYLTRVKTDDNGNYVVPSTWSNAGSVTYRALYGGSPTYLTTQKEVSVTMEKIPTTLTLSGPAYARVRLNYTIGGNLTDQAGKGLTNKVVALYWRYQGDASWTWWYNATTNASGHFNVTDEWALVHTVEYQAAFSGDGAHANATSGIVTVPVITGSWQNVTVDNGDAGSLALDAAGYPHVIYDPGNNSLK